MQLMGVANFSIIAAQQLHGRAGPESMAQRHTQSHPDRLAVEGLAVSSEQSLEQSLSVASQAYVPVQYPPASPI